MIMPAMNVPTCCKTVPTWLAQKGGQGWPGGHLQNRCRAPGTPPSSIKRSNSRRAFSDMAVWTAAQSSASALITLPELASVSK